MSNVIQCDNFDGLPCGNINIPQREVHKYREVNCFKNPPQIKNAEILVAKNLKIPKVPLSSCITKNPQNKLKISQSLEKLLHMIH
jgi:hypothetical protein